MFHFSVFLELKFEFSSFSMLSFSCKKTLTNKLPKKKKKIKSNFSFSYTQPYSLASVNIFTKLG